jgi:glucokinase
LSEREYRLAGLSLIADIGATHARFAVASPAGAIENIQVLACKEYRSLEEAIDAYLHSGPQAAGLRHFTAAALAVAGPTAGDHVAFTNHPWSFSKEDLRRRLGVDRLLVVNDFTAVAAAIPYLQPNERAAIGGGTAAEFAPIAVLGPGSGLGVSGLIPTGKQWFALSGEGGHTTLPAMTAREGVVVDHMRRQFGHVSAERALSGPGLVNLYHALAEIDDVRADIYTPAQIADRKIGERDPRCREATSMFCAMLGTVAGNLALTLGARGGVYIAGGIVPTLGAVFSTSGFRERFEDKGRMRSFLVGIPTYVITHPFPAFVGLARLTSHNSLVLPGTN